MKKGNLFAFTISQLKQLYNCNLPYLVQIASVSDDFQSFREGLYQYAIKYMDGGEREKAAKRILLLLENERKKIHELSTGELMHIRSWEYLWQFLKEQLPESTCTDLYLDFYFLFMRLENPLEIKPDKNVLKHQMKRWETGLDEQVIEKRAENIERIIHLLMRKIEGRHGKNSKYIYPEGISHEEKYNLVKEWWKESRFHLAMAIKSPTELNNFLGNSLSQQTMELLLRAKKKGMPFFVTPYYLSLLNTGTDGFDDTTIRTYILW